jgi:hypothetical protein
MALINGQAEELQPMQAGPTIDFGAPIGEAETIFTLHSEVLTFGESFGADNVTFALSLPDRVLRHLNELVGASEERVADAARSASPPSDRTVAVHLVEVSDEEATVRARSVTEPLKRWGLGGGIVSTASPAAAAVRLLARRRIDAVGALPPERCIDPDEMFAELKTRGVRFEVSAAPRTDERPLVARAAR